MHFLRYTLLVSSWSDERQTCQSIGFKLAQGNSVCHLRARSPRRHSAKVCYGSPRKAPFRVCQYQLDPTQLLLQVGNHWHLIDRRLDLKSCQVLTHARLPGWISLASSISATHSAKERGQGCRSKQLFQVKDLVSLSFNFKVQSVDVASLPRGGKETIICIT